MMKLSTTTHSPLREVDVDDIMDSHNNAAAATNNNNNTNATTTTDVALPAKKTECTASWKSALLSVVAYLYTLLSLTSWWFFQVSNQFLPDTIASMKWYSIDTASIVPSIWTAAFKNMSVMAAFGFAHSLFARKWVKQWMGLPVAAERAFFCMQAALLLHLVQMAWVEVEGGPIWDLTAWSLTTTLVLTIYWLGTVFTLTSTFALDHFRLFGLSQGLGIDLNGKLGLTPPTASSGLATRWHYHYVANPIYTGFLCNFWFTPVMTGSRLVLALFMTAYVVTATIRFEEPAIREELGAAYDDYLKKTPRFFPAVPYKLKIEKVMKKE